MTAPSPDDLPGLVEAVAEAIHASACSPDFQEPARAAAAAMVEHLGLVEVYTLRDDEGDIWADAEGPREAAEQIQGSETLVRRLVTPWQEVQP